MSESSEIGWTDATWPIVAGCEYASPGCSNCWAVRDSWRLAHNPNPRVHTAYFGTVDKTPDGKLVWSGIIRPLWNRLNWPLKWTKPRRIFVCSQADLFHPKVRFNFIAAVFGIAAMCPQHTMQMLTKHPGRARMFFTWLTQQQGGPLATCLWEARSAVGGALASLNEPFPDDPPPWPLENVWLGATVEDQRRADERINELLTTPAAKRWLSVEPMLEAINVSPWLTPCGPGIVPPDPHGRDQGIDWVVCGGESAQTRATTRPFDLAWARDLRDQCKAAGVPFFMKQLGTKPRDRGLEWGSLPGKSSRYKWHEMQHWPEDLQIQEFPA